MEIERNVVFIYPLTKKLEELKDSIETDHPDIMVYEMESVAEFAQLIGIMEFSVTFSSDMPKTEEYLKKTKSFVCKPNSNNCIVLNTTMPPHIKARLTSAGINKVFQEKEVENGQLLDHTLSFFERCEKGELDESKSMSNEIGIGGNQKENAKNDSDHFMVKNLTTEIGSHGKVDQDHQKIKRNKSLELIGSALQQDLKLKRMALGVNFLGSAFDRLQRKNVKTFEPVLKDLKRKNTIQFKEVEPKYKRKKRPNMDFQPIGAKSRKNASFSPVNRANQKKHKKFEPVTREYDRKRRGLFEPVQRDAKREKLRENKKREMQRRKAKFEAVQRKLERKNKKFQEVHRELQRKKSKGIEPREREKLRKKFEEHERELERKRKRFEEVERQYEHARKRLDKAKEYEREEIEKELKELDKRNKELFEELEREGPEWDKNIDELAREHEFPPPVEQESKKGPEWERGLFDEEVPWNELGLDDADELDKKKDNFYADEEVVKRINEASYLEDSNERQDGVTVSLSIKTLREQVLNYQDFKIKQTSGELELSEEEALLLQAELYEEEINEEDKQYFLPDSMGLEYLALYNDLLHNKQAQTLHLCRLIQFAYKKEFEAPLSVYVFNPQGLHGVSTLCEGHLEENIFFDKESFDAYKTENLEKWKSQKLPSFSDETFMSDKNEFVFPFFTDGVHQGFSVSHFHPLKAGHRDAKKIELLSICLQGILQYEYMKANGADS